MIEKLAFPLGVMVRVTVVVCLTPPPMPVTVIGYVPVLATFVTVMVMIELPDPGAPMVLGLKLTDTPMGWPEAERLMELSNPPLIVVVASNIARPFCGMLTVDGETERVKLPCADRGKVNRKKINRGT